MDISISQTCYEETEDRTETEYVVLSELPRIGDDICCGAVSGKVESVSWEIRGKNDSGVNHTYIRIQLEDFVR